MGGVTQWWRDQRTGKVRASSGANGEGENEEENQDEGDKDAESVTALRNIGDEAESEEKESVEFDICSRSLSVDQLRSICLLNQLLFDTSSHIEMDG